MTKPVNGEQSRCRRGDCLLFELAYTIIIMTKTFPLFSHNTKAVMDKTASPIDNLDT